MLPVLTAMKAGNKPALPGQNHWLRPEAPVPQRLTPSGLIYSGPMGPVKIYLSYPGRSTRTRAGWRQKLSCCSPPPPYSQAPATGPAGQTRARAISRPAQCRLGLPPSGKSARKARREKTIKTSLVLNPQHSPRVSSRSAEKTALLHYFQPDEEGKAIDKSGLLALRST